MNPEQDIAWPSMARIAHETGLTKNTARKWLDYLHGKGWLIKKKNSHFHTSQGGTQLHNEYIITIPKQVIRGVIDLPTLDKGGSNDEQRGVNHLPKGGQQLPPNNNIITNNNNYPNLDQKAWLLWSEYRKEIKKPIKPASEKTAMKKMAELGEKQMEAVEYSIANGYQGLFTPRSNGKAKTAYGEGGI